MTDETAIRPHDRARRSRLGWPPGWPAPGHPADGRRRLRGRAVYSIASAPGEPVAITVERLDDGEVSPYLTEEVRPGDEIEIRGPIGGYFVWSGDDADSPLLLVAGGSGVVPFRSILRHRAGSAARCPSGCCTRRGRCRTSSTAPSWTSPRDGVEVIYTLTRQQPPGWDGHSGRVTRALLREVAWPASQHPIAYVCGPTAFVETVAAGLVSLGYPPDRVKTERSVRRSWRPMMDAARRQRDRRPAA